MQPQVEHDTTVQTGGDKRINYGSKVFPTYVSTSAVSAKGGKAPWLQPTSAIQAGAMIPTHASVPSGVISLHQQTALEETESRWRIYSAALFGFNFSLFHVTFTAST